MIHGLNEADIADKIILPNGEIVVLIDRLGKGDRYSKEDLSRNVFMINAEDQVLWQVHSNFDKYGEPFTRLHLGNGVLTAYRWDGGSYVIDIASGAATPLILER